MNKKYWLSFVEYGIMNEKYFDCVGGRLEVHNEEDEKNPWAEKEIGYLTRNKKEYYEFREKWDFKNVTPKELEQVEKELENKYKDAYNE